MNTPNLPSPQETTELLENKDAQERMAFFIEVVECEGTLWEILFARNCLERLNRKYDNYCAAQLENLDNCIQTLRKKNMEENRLKELLAGANLTLNGSQINLGGENTIINNYYRQEDAPSVDGKADKGDFAPSAKERLCESLSTDRAREEFAKFQKAGMLDENYQPIHLTRPQMGCIVIRMSAVLGLASQWKDFGRLWDIDSELLRTQFAKGQDSEPTREFNRILLSL